MSALPFGDPAAKVVVQELMEQINRLSLAAQSALTAVGHEVGLLSLPRGDDALLWMECARCPLFASLDLLTTADGVRTMILTLPGGVCTAAGLDGDTGPGTPAAEGTNDAPDGGIDARPLE